MEEAIAGLLEGVTDVNALLADTDAEVQSIVAGNDRIVITGVHTGGSPITSTHLLEALRDLAGKTTTAAPPPERLGPGVVDGIAAEGSRYYLALGDSLAANVGVDRPALGYVSRLHRWLQARDGAGYGLRNFGVPGETSGTLIRGGQLDSAVEFIRAHRVAYISVDIGANDLLAHLAGPDCAPGLDAPSCASRIESTMAAYRGNIEEVFRRLRSAAPDATIVFLSAYNPFSLGLGTSFEAQSDAALVELNLIAAAAASRFGILVADGLTPMQGAAGTATHMLANPPDIHPTAAGHDVLAAALADAIGW
jgi:lysophospholipase L1-like esterase